MFTLEKLDEDRLGLETHVAFLAFGFNGGQVLAECQLTVHTASFADDHAPGWLLLVAQFVVRAFHQLAIKFAIHDPLECVIGLLLKTHAAAIASNDLGVGHL